MKASIRTVYGTPEVLHIADIPKPTPQPGEVLVRVRAASVNLGDWEILTGRPRYIRFFAALMGPKSRDGVEPRNYGLWKPRYKVLGTDVAGVVETVGEGDARFEVGDEVFGDCAGFGSFAEFVRVPSKAVLVKKPAGVTFEQAGTLGQASAIAVQGIVDKGQVREGHKVLINGAGGGAGSFALHLAKSRGAEVTGVDGPGKQELMRSIGADHVNDFTKEEFTANGEIYDVVLDLAAYRSVFRARRSLAAGGIYIVAGGDWRSFWQSVFLGPVISRLSDRRVAFLMAESRASDLELMAGMIEDGSFSPVIDQVYPLEQAGEAIRSLGEKRSKGKVVVVP